METAEEERVPRQTGRGILVSTFFVTLRGEYESEKWSIWSAIQRIKGLIQRLGEKTAAIEINSVLPLFSFWARDFYVSKTANCHLRSASAFKSTWIHIWHQSNSSNNNGKLLEIPQFMPLDIMQPWVKGWQALQSSHAILHSASNGALLNPKAKLYCGRHSKLITGGLHQLLM